MTLKRREFLEKAGLALLSLGIGEWSMGLNMVHGEAIAGTPSVNHSINNLSQLTRRKLALLVGINQYPTLESLQNNPLQGCLTDVELQRELLIHRFGFHPSDILVLTDSQATRQNILNGFISHLQEQVQPGDVVVFHFSGYGSRIYRYDHPEILQNSLVPVDDIFPTSHQPFVNDLLEETLILLLDSLQTENVIGIFDTSYVYPGINAPGNFRIRTRARPIIGQQNEQSSLFHQRLESQKLPMLKKGKKFPLILRAANLSQPVAEGVWNGFSAGFLTYQFTQTLWSMTPSQAVSLLFYPSLESSIDFPEKFQLASADPVNTLLKLEQFSTIFNGGQNSADGVVINSEENGKFWNLWLGGLTPYLLDSLGINSIFRLVSSQENEANSSVQLQIRSRNGLMAKAQIKSGDTTNFGENYYRQFSSDLTGQWIKESIRVIPRNTNLMIGIDPHLERIERVDATSALAGISQISPVIGGQAADYLFGRLMTTIAQNPDVPLSSLTQGRYGLFSLTHAPLSHSLGQGEEAIKIAVQRLTPQLKTLLAMKLLRLTNNENSTDLQVKATLMSVSPNLHPLIEKSSIQFPKNQTKNSKIHPIKEEKIPLGSSLQYQIENHSKTPLYWIVFCLDNRGRVLLINPQTDGEISLNDESQDLDSLILSGERIEIPANHLGNQGEKMGWTFTGNPGIVETHIIFNTRPFSQTLKAVEGGFEPLRNNESIIKLTNPLKVTQAILEDLEKGCNSQDLMNTPPEDWTLDMKTWATLSFIYTVG